MEATGDRTWIVTKIDFDIIAILPAGYITEKEHLALSIMTITQCMDGWTKELSPNSSSKLS